MAINWPLIAVKLVVATSWVHLLRFGQNLFRNWLVGSRKLEKWSEKGFFFTFASVLRLKSKKNNEKKNLTVFSKFQNGGYFLELKKVSSLSKNFNFKVVNCSNISLSKAIFPFAKENSNKPPLGTHCLPWIVIPTVTIHSVSIFSTVLVKSLNCITKILSLSSVLNPPKTWPRGWNMFWVVPSFASERN